MNKRQLHHFWRRFRLIKFWYFLLLAIVFTVICMFSLRANSEHMASLRDTLYSVDKGNGDVQAALNDLQAYVTAHMNTSLNTGGVYPPVQLQYTYERLVQKQGSQLQASNGDLYTAAQAYCQAQNPTGFSGSGRVPCIQQYVKDHGSQTSLTAPIPPSLYQFDFVAPKWSPDLAGWSMVLAVVFALTGIFVLGTDFWIKRKLR